AVLHQVGAAAHAKDFGPHRDVPLLAGVGVPGDQSPMSGASPDAATEDQMRRTFADRDIAAFAATWLDVILPCDRTFEADRRHAHRPVVLLRAVHPARHVLVRCYVIELRGR